MATAVLAVAWMLNTCSGGQITPGSRPDYCSAVSRSCLPSDSCLVQVIRTPQLLDGQHRGPGLLGLQRNGLVRLLAIASNSPLVTPCLLPGAAAAAAARRHFTSALPAPAAPISTFCCVQTVLLFCCLAAASWCHHAASRPLLCPALPVPRLLEGHKQPLYCGAFNHFHPKLLGDLFATVGGNRVGALLLAAPCRLAGTPRHSAAFSCCRLLSSPAPRAGRPPSTAAGPAASCRRCRRTPARM